jgi:hypothetical protein
VATPPTLAPEIQVHLCIVMNSLWTTGHATNPLGLSFPICNEKELMLLKDLLLLEL